MSFVIDTNVISELRKARSGKADRDVLAWAARVPATELFISAITVMELEAGVLQAERRDHPQGAMLRSWLETRVLPEFAGRVLAIDDAVARLCARLHVPDCRPDRDALIAATALIHGMTVATRDTEDFVPTGVALVNPWLGST